MKRGGDRHLKLIAAWLVASLMFVGCQVDTRHRTGLSREQVQAEALEYMSSKYSQRFEVALAHWSGEWEDERLLPTGGGTVFDVYPQGGSKDQISSVEVDSSTSPISFHDCYAAQLQTVEYENRARAALAEVAPGALVVVQGLGRGCVHLPPDEFNLSTPFEEFKAWADTKHSVPFCVFVPLQAGEGGTRVASALPPVKARLETLAGSGNVQLQGFPQAQFEAKVLPNEEKVRDQGNCWPREIPRATAEVSATWGND